MLYEVITTDFPRDRCDVAVVGPAAAAQHRDVGETGEDVAIFAAQLRGIAAVVITSYIIHYTKLYEPPRRAALPLPLTLSCIPSATPAGIFIDTTSSSRFTPSRNNFV